MAVVLGWWEREVVEPGKLPLLLCLVAFVATFLTTRAVTRLIRSGSWWCRRRYADRSEVAARATERAAAFDARWLPLFRRLGAAVAGRPTPPGPTPPGPTPPGPTPPGPTAPGAPRPSG